MTRWVVLVGLPLGAAFQTSVFVAAFALTTQGRRWLRLNPFFFLVCAAVFLTVYVTAVLLAGLLAEGRAVDEVPWQVDLVLVQMFVFAIGYWVFLWRRHLRDPEARADWRATPLVFRGWFVASVAAAAFTWVAAVLSLKLPPQG